MSNYGPVSTSPTGMFSRVCRNCGRQFRTDNPRQRYCSVRCKRSAQNRRYYQKQRRIRAAMRRADELTDYGRYEPCL